MVRSVRSRIVESAVKEMLLAGEPAARSATPDHGLQRFGRNRIVRRWLQGDEPVWRGHCTSVHGPAPRGRLGAGVQAGSGVDRGNVRIRHLVMRERFRRESERGEPGRGRGVSRTAAPDRHQHQGRLVLRIDVQQPVDRFVGIAGHQRGRELKGRRLRQKIGRHAARVPPGMAIGSRLILPGAAPPRARQHQHHRRVGHGGVRAARLDQDSPAIARPQQAQRGVLWLELIDAGRQVFEVGADHVDLDVVERAGARRSAEQDLAARIAPSLGDADRRQQTRQLIPARDPVAADVRSRVRQRGQRRNRRVRQVRRERLARHAGIDLEGQRHVGKVEGVGIGANALPRVLGGLVIVKGPHDFPVNGPRPAIAACSAPPRSRTA